MPAVLLIPQGGTLTLGPTATATDVSCQVTNAAIVSTPNPKTITTLCGVQNTAGDSSYVLHIEAAQDWSADSDSLSQFLWDNEGQVVDFSLTPTVAGNPTASGQVTVVAGDFSGPSGEIPTLSVDLGCGGKPTITPPVAGDATRREPAATAA